MRDAVVEFGFLSIEILRYNLPLSKLIHRIVASTWLQHGFTVGSVRPTSLHGLDD